MNSPSLHFAGRFNLNNERYHRNFIGDATVRMRERERCGEYMSQKEEIIPCTK